MKYKIVATTVPKPRTNVVIRQAKRLRVLKMEMPMLLELLPPLPEGSIILSMMMVVTCKVEKASLQMEDRRGRLELVQWVDDCSN